ncbi:MAG: LamG domain-containing protein [Patescibacteria group bacterium]|nr:LamG domain-containing protein [Patescibacteria group bacterium]MCL5432108.1 LamG domain-containing protein [Patescibacteria group bacterium]
MEHPDVGNGAGQGCGYYNQVRATCVGAGCHWTPAPNSCAPGSSCAGGSCTTECGDTASCTVTPYTPIYPFGTISELNPTFTWNVVVPADYNGTNYYTNLAVYAGSNCPGSPIFFNQPAMSDTSKSWSVISPNQYLSPNTQYSWNLYEGYNGVGHPESTSACLNFQTAASCTVSLSASPTTIVNSGTATATVYPTGNATVTAVNWNFNPTGVVSTPAPSTTPTGSSVPASFSPNSGGDLLSGLVAYWKLDGGNVGDNSVPAQNSVSGTYGPASGTTVIGPSSSPASKIGNARSFNGTSDIITAANPQALSGSRTIAAWVYPTNTSSKANPVLVGGTASLNNGDLFGVSGSGAVGCAGAGKVYFDHWGYTCNLSTGTVPLNTWSLIMMTFDNTTKNINFYINNQPAGTILGSTGAATYNANQIWLGGNPYSGSSTTGLSFAGSIDEIGIWNRVLSSGEIQDLYHGGAGNTYQPAATVWTASSTLTNQNSGTTTTSFTATATLDTGGSCTSSPVALSTVGTFFQTYGGDVIGKGTVNDSHLPSGAYISGN